MGSVGRNPDYKAYHMTSSTNADSVVQNGYNARLSENGTNGDVWGGGMYLATAKESADWSSFGNGQIEATIDTRGFLTVKLSKDYDWGDEETMFKDASKFFGKRQTAFFNQVLQEERDRLANPPKAVMPKNLTPEQQRRWERRQAWINSHSHSNFDEEPSYRYAFFKTMDKFHIAGLNIKYDNPKGARSLVGGNQIVVRDTSRIKNLRRVK